MRNAKNAPRARLAIVLLASLIAWVPCPRTAAADLPTVRVGTFDNSPIVFAQPDHAIGGIAIDVLREIARREHWELVFVHGPWAEKLQELESGKIDILVGIAYSEPRAERFAYSRETLLSNWGLVFKRHGTQIASLLDLEGKRLALMQRSIHTTAMEQELKQFGVNFTPVAADNYAGVLRLVESGQADAGVVNRVFSALNAANFDVDATAIVFNPVQVRYAAPKNADPAILNAVDRHLAQMRAVPSSVYHASLNRWLGGSRPVIPSWLGPAAGILGLTLIIAVLWTLLLRAQVKTRTRELLLKSRELEQEIDRRTAAQDKLNQLAFYDSLTGFPNRVLFRDRLQQAITEQRRDGHRGAIMFLDLDRFKDINDSLGHSAGDAALKVLAERFTHCVRNIDTIARVGGDEFLVLLPRVDTPERAASIARRILDACTPPVDIEGREVYLSGSIGISLFPDDASDIDTLHKHADTAMYHAKAAGRGRLTFYSREMTERAEARMRLETDLRRALERSELSLVYQPIVDLRTGTAVGCEALLRWQHPERGDVPPSEFVPVAEDTGLIAPIGEWALDTACRQCRRWNDLGQAPLTVSVNLSYRQFAQGDLVEIIERALRENGLDASRLELELTEGLFMENTELVSETLEELRRRGIHTAVDDFGTGYSSLSYLTRLPLHTVKIDRAFVARLPDHPHDAALATAMINMAHSLKYRTVAEGVETEAQLDFLRRQGCDAAQGYLLGRPMDAEAFETWLAAQGNRTETQ
jgi:diguanylate cyclase (GGDEF)-like protein